MLSKYQLMIFNDFFKKLMPNVFVKENYMLHYENLQLQLKLALKIKKYILFQNSINHNGINHMSSLTQNKRLEAEKIKMTKMKALYNLMKNSVYGKTIKNLRNRIDVKLVSSKKGFLNWTSKPS